MIWTLGLHLPASMGFYVRLLSRAWIALAIRVLAAVLQTVSAVLQGPLDRMAGTRHGLGARLSWLHHF